MAQLDPGKLQAHMLVLQGNQIYATLSQICVCVCLLPRSPKLQVATDVLHAGSKQVNAQEGSSLRLNK